MKPSVAASSRNAWRWFVLAAVLAAAWFGLNLLAPDLSVGRIPLRLLLVLACDAVVLYGLWRALGRAPFSPSMCLASWLAVALALAIWIGTIWTLAMLGVFQRSIGNVPLLPVAIFLPVLFGSFVLTRSRAVASLLDATPPSWLVGIQVYRILGGMFLVYWIHGTMPGAFALPAGIGDVATGLLALPAAVWVTSGSAAGRRIGIRWNLLGLVDFAVAITMGMLTSPGPAHLLARDHPNLQIATFPTAMVPAFVVPFSTLLHVLSLRQLTRVHRTASATREEPTFVAGSPAPGSLAGAAAPRGAI